MPIAPTTAGSVRSNRFDDAAVNALEVRARSGEASPAEVNALLDHFGDGIEPALRDRLTALLPSSAEIQARPVTSLRDAPGLLNGSVVLPNSGREHPSVAVLQGALSTLAQRSGNGSLAVDRTGVFDAPTGEAVRAFQKQNGLVADGIVGPRTARALKAALRGEAGPNILVGRLPDATPKPAADPKAVGKAATMLVDKYAQNYGTDDAWYNIDPNHALPANVKLGGLKGAWKCNLFGGNALVAGGFEAPYYGNRGKGEYPNANQFFKWSDKYAEKFGNKVHFKMIGEVDVNNLPLEKREAAIQAVLDQAQPGDLLMVDHLGDEIVDGGHTRVVTEAVGADGKLQTAQAGSNQATVHRYSAGNFSGEETLWILRPNRPAKD